jgi:hypothetical protein
MLTNCLDTLKCPCNAPGTLKQIVLKFEHYLTGVLKLLVIYQETLGELRGNLR